MNEHLSLNRTMLKEVILAQKQEFDRLSCGTSRDILPEFIELFDTKKIIVIQGVRFCGKSTLLKQFVDKLNLTEFHYLNFADERLVSLQRSSFDLLLEIFYEINGAQHAFIFDEIQQIAHWEDVIHRLHHDDNTIIVTTSYHFKFSNHYAHLTLQPFSFNEFLQFKHMTFQKNDLMFTEKRGMLHKYFAEYLICAGFPFYLENQRLETLQNIYKHIIFYNNLEHQKIDNIRLFRQLTLYLTSNCTALISYNKLKQYFKLGSVNTVIKYINYLENSYYLYLVNAFSTSSKKQINAPKKIYIISNAFIDKVGFCFANKKNVLLENLVFLQLKNLFQHIYYYKTQNNLTVDFIIYNDSDEMRLIQVCSSLTDPDLKRNKTNALIKAMRETHTNDSWILTETEESIIKIDDLAIHVMPVYQWLLS